MARPKTHTGVSVVMIILISGLSFLFSFSVSCLDVGWIFLLGVLVDADHLPFGRLWKAFRNAGLRGVLESWEKDGWLDSNHLNVFHTWWMLVAVIVFSLLVGNYMPIIAFGIHMLVDSACLDQLDYPKCSPMPTDILLGIGLRFYPEWILYHTAGLSSVERR